MHGLKCRQPRQSHNVQEVLFMQSNLQVPSLSFNEKPTSLSRNPSLNGVGESSSTQWDLDCNRKSCTSETSALIPGALFITLSGLQISKQSWRRVKAEEEGASVQPDSVFFKLLTLNTLI